MRDELTQLQVVVLCEAEDKPEFSDKRRYVLARRTVLRGLFQSEVSWFRWSTARGQLILRGMLDVDHRVTAAGREWLDRWVSLEVDDGN